MHGTDSIKIRTSYLTHNSHMFVARSLHTYPESSITRKWFKSADLWGECEPPYQQHVALRSYW